MKKKEIFQHNEKISNIPFGHSQKKQDEQEHEKHKRKEINLSELQKAIEESLDKKSDAEEFEKEEIVEEKKDENKKGIINPGEKIKL